MKRMHARKNGAKPNRAGFSLVDLTITMMILAILAAVAIPRFVDALQFHRANAAADRVVADMLLARHSAVTTSSDQTVSFELELNRYLVFPLASIDHPGESYRVDLAGEPYRVELVSVDFGGTSAVTFNGYGQPATGGTIVVQSGEHQKTVLLDATTGQAAVQ